jgi:hypothetical protein
VTEELAYLSPASNVPSGADRLLADVHCKVAVMDAEAALDRCRSAWFATAQTRVHRACSVMHSW